jgi:hypothetical protein
MPHRCSSISSRFRFLLDFDFPGTTELSRIVFEEVLDASLEAFVEPGSVPCGGRRLIALGREEEPGRLPVALEDHVAPDRPSPASVRAVFVSHFLIRLAVLRTNHCTSPASS